jgi:cellobionic acid phosphorylase
VCKRSSPIGRPEIEQEKTEGTETEKVISEQKSELIPMLRPTDNGERFELTSPTAMPRAAGFLWNRKMLLQVTCRGYAVAQFMQPEPAKYAYAPHLEAKTFMQPEQPYYTHHPGRFFYVKDEETGELFSAPYEPVRAKLDRYSFSVGKSDIRWCIEKSGIALDITLSLAADDVVELWSLQLRNASGRVRKLSIYPYFPIGYMSWMNQAARHRAELGGIVATCVTPYQKVADYFKVKNFKDRTFFLAEQPPVAWETRREVFEGEGGLHNPTGVQVTELSKSDALYETPAAVLQYRIQLVAGQTQSYRFIFGPAFDDSEIIELRGKYLGAEGFNRAARQYGKYIEQGKGCLTIQTPDPELDNFVNHWLPRQIFYHGDVNRLTTDPQTRNYLQDNMGMSYIDPQVTGAAFLRALSQQEAGGAMPDGILVAAGAELKYINRIPHTDHCVWFPICLKPYLDETNDYGFLQIQVRDREGRSQSVFERITGAMRWLLKARDERGRSYIGQGDWCDPMNMVGHKGKGVSGWLTLATAYALNVWAEVCAEQGESQLATEFKTEAAALNQAANGQFWDGQWFARGITDDGILFGTSKDKEGRLFLNPQSWAMLAGAANEEQRGGMIRAIEEELETPYGVMLLAPPFTSMREDIGRVTQKFPGSAENGSVYNHAAAFYIYSLYKFGESDRAFRLMRQMIPGPDMADYEQRGQLPVFIPNYYRGAWREYPRTAGRSSQLFNTGTVAWLYRCLVEGLFGVKGEREGLVFAPQLPTHWNECKLTRQFRGATFSIEIRRDAALARATVNVDGQTLTGTRFTGFQRGKTYSVVVSIPKIRRAASESS